LKDKAEGKEIGNSSLRMGVVYVVYYGEMMRFHNINTSDSIKELVPSLLLYLLISELQIDIVDPSSQGWHEAKTKKGKMRKIEDYFYMVRNDMCTNKIAQV